MVWATVSSWSYFCWLYRASPSLAAKNRINLISVLTIWWCPCVESSLVLLEHNMCVAVTSAFSWQNSISLCLASFRIPRPNLPVTPGVSWLHTFAFQSPIMKRTSFGGVSSKYLYSVLNSNLNLFNSSPWCPLECNPPDPCLCQPSHVLTPQISNPPPSALFLITWNGIIIYSTDQVEFIDWDCSTHNHLAFPYIPIGFARGNNFEHCKTTTTTKWDGIRKMNSLSSSLLRNNLRVFTFVTWFREALLDR